MFDDLIGISTKLIESWINGGRVLRIVLSLSIFSTIGAFATITLGETGITEKEFTEIVAATFGVITFLLTIGVISYQNALEKSKNSKKIEAIEKRVEENPKETMAAWDLARIKLEHYLNKNIRQVSAVFWLTVIVMFFGFGLIAYGVINAFSSQNNIYPSLIASVSGVLVNFVGATFLVIYKSTMQQAKEYMSIIERINAVGMSVQILENLDGDDTALKSTTMADISKQLLNLYINGNPKSG